MICYLFFIVVFSFLLIGISVNYTDSRFRIIEIKRKIINLEKRLDFIQKNSTQRKPITKVKGFQIKSK